MTDRWYDERLLGEWRAALPWGSTNLVRVPGKLVLTNYRLAFQGSVLHSRRSHFTLLRDVSSVQPSSSYPRLHLSLVSGETRVYLIFAPGLTMTWNRRNLPARDDARQRIAAAVTSARSGWWPPTSPT